MKSMFYSGASGLIAYQNALDTIGNNIANANTPGFRGQRVSFENLLYNEMYANTPTNPLTGHGVRSVSTGLKTNQGSTIPTGFALDFAIAGDGMFAIEKNGEIQYTRDGTFQIGLEAGGAYLTTQDGSYVLDKYHRRIPLYLDPDTSQYDLNGLSDKLGVFVFDSPSNMTPVSGNRFVPTDLSGNAVGAPEGSYKIMNGYIEFSNTELSDEMANMITVQRAFQVSSRVVQVSDENEQTINNLRR